jgi:hypothetical protein
MDVSLLPTAPLINGVLDLTSNISNMPYKLAQNNKQQLGCQQEQDQEMERNVP